MNLNPIDRDMLIRTVIGEAGREPVRGQAGVVHVVLNRLKSGKHGKDVQDVVFAKNQFEPWSTRRSELLSYDAESEDYQRAAAIVDAAATGQLADPTEGATHFLNEDVVRDRRGGGLPKWAQGQGRKIGRHTFHAPEGRVQVAQATEVNDPEILKAFGAKAAPAVAGAAQAAKVQAVSDPEVLKAFGVTTDGSPPEGLTPPGTPARPILPGKELGIGGSFVQGFASNEQEAIRHLAQSLYPDEPIDQAVGRFGQVDGILVHQGGDGQLYRALPEGMSLAGVASGLAQGAGRSLPVLAGTATGILTAPAAMAGPGGLAASLAATGGAAGAAEAGRQMLGDYMMGDAATGDLSVAQIASEAGSSLVGQGAGAGTAALRTRGAVRDIAQLDPQRAQQAYREAGAVGIPITPAEATGLPTLAAQQKRLTNITPTANQMREFLARRDAQVIGAWDNFLTRVSPVADAETVGKMGRDTAGGVFADMKATLQAAAAPKYQQAFAEGDKELWSPALERLTGSPAISSAMQGAVNKWADNAIADGYGAMNPRAQVQDGRVRFGGRGIPAFPNLQFWDYVKRNLDQQVQTAITAGKSDRARVLTKLTGQLRNELDTLAPGTYAEARSIWGTGAEDIAGAMESALGTISKLKDTQVLRAAQNIFNPETRSPEMVVRLKGALQDKNPLAWQALKRQYLQDVTRGALRTAESGDVLNPAGKIHKAFMDPYAQANIRAALTPEEWQDMKSLLVVFKRASSVPALRSDTEFNRLMTKDAEDAAKPLLAKIAGRNVNVFKWGTAAEEFLTNRNLEKHANQVVNLVTSGDPQAIDTMKELRRLSPWDRRWTVLFGHLLTRGAVAGGGALMPEPDYAPNAQAGGRAY